MLMRRLLIEIVFESAEQQEYPALKTISPNQLTRLDGISLRVAMLSDYRLPEAITAVAAASNPSPNHRPRLAGWGALFHSPVITPDKFAVMIMKI